MFSRMEPYMRDYTASERAAFEAPPCPQCGSTRVTVNWEETTDNDTIGQTWMPTLFTCQACRGTGTRL